HRQLFPAAAAAASVLVQRADGRRLPRDAGRHGVPVLGAVRGQGGGRDEFQLAPGFRLCWRSRPQAVPDVLVRPRRHERGQRHGAPHAILPRRHSHRELDRTDREFAGRLRDAMQANASRDEVPRGRAGL
ncbi:uncharacterized protein METZ01_LOCUS476081, partial [marine metagenome]